MRPWLLVLATPLLLAGEYAPLTGSTVSSDLISTVPITKGGTGQATAGAGFNALAPTTTRGDLIRRGAATNERVALGANGTCLTSNGTDAVWGSCAGQASEAFPVGSVFISVVSTNPNTLLGYGTWSAIGAGRTLVGLDAGQTEFDTVEETGGAKTHTLSAAEMPAHTHVLTELRDATTGGATTNIALTADTSSTTGTKVSGSTGGGGAHNNLQPYLVVYFWKRTA